ncbi:putative stress protein (general stress protein 26) [Planoprotostelium fungivorum]|uniref:Putative stress protein (General stress protein 26) n=1 Tax=Planoprotostelium fungivorum TaxID=1890364 RepID=A0A2P6NZN2_9EUKA|nr:putative stress protein (general stress protein 26) [Planoprotostelium fungivorum]
MGPVKEKTVDLYRRREVRYVTFEFVGLSPKSYHVFFPRCDDDGTIPSTTQSTVPPFAFLREDFRTFTSHHIRLQISAARGVGACCRPYRSFAQFLLRFRTNTMSKQSEDVNHFYEIVKSFGACMLVSKFSDEKMHGRPMRIVSVEDGGIWMYTSVNSPKVDEIEHNQIVGLTFQDGSRWVSMTGTAEIVRQQDKIEKYWVESLKPWFPQGTQTPDIALIKVHPDGGEFWDIGGIANKISFTFGLAKAYLTQTRAEPQKYVDVHKVAL